MKVAESLASENLPVTSRRAGGSLTLIAWRNLWRNRRRTWLTSGGIAFAVWLLVFSMSMQDGTFEIMVDNGARLALGHVQIQHPAYQDDPRMEYTLTGSERIRSAAEGKPAVVAASEQAQSFALVSHGERSFGAQVFGVDFVREAAWSSLPTMVRDGRYLAGPGEAVVGSVLARNLGLAVGDEIVVLGTAKEGGVAATLATVVGTFTSGQVALDRALMQIPIGDFREAWGLAPDEAHVVVVLAGSVAESVRLAEELQTGLGTGARVLDWRDLMPEAVQTIDVKYIGTLLFFALVAVIVTFSIVNTFMMTVFERTPEFGMLMAIGMKPGRIMAQLALEALFLALLGVVVGLALSAAVLVPLSAYGMPLPASATEVLSAYNLPDRMYPRFSNVAASASAAILLLGTQLAALIPALRIRRMRPVEALRAAE
jgi:putative ABC transport system permease protein